MPSTGVVIGKFYPPHRGHKHLIDYAAARVDNLTVIVCERPQDAIPGTLRAAWLREIHPDAEVLLIDDHYDEADSRVWAANTVRWLGRAPDFVFTSEDYGERYARYMGSVHVLVDRERLAVPVSGTAVRRDPLGCWEYLEPCVRVYFAPRICVVGAESTGTTTLARALAEHYRTAWVPEYGRLYSEAKLPAAESYQWDTSEFTFIAEQQAALEDRLVREANRVLIYDTDPFATGIWHERYLGYRSPSVEAIAATRRYALYLVTDVDIPFVQDGTRDGEHIREWMHGRFLAELTRQGKRFAVLAGSHETRLRKAVELVDGVMEEVRGG
jgi:NadR type nicotinamide-nucleotide adenylyltransferase